MLKCSSGVSSLYTKLKRRIRSFSTLQPMFAKDIGKYGAQS